MSASYLQLCEKLPPQGDPGVRLAWDDKTGYFELYVKSGDTIVRKAPPFASIDFLSDASNDILERVK